jgi:hypothetical protein
VKAVKEPSEGIREGDMEDARQWFSKHLNLPWTPDRPPSLALTVSQTRLPDAYDAETIAANAIEMIDKLRDNSRALQHVKLHLDGLVSDVELKSEPEPEREP